MRRPLFGNGIPLLVAGGGPTQVFDTTEADPPGEHYTYALTLFGWEDPSDGVTISLITEGNASSYALYSASEYDALRFPNNGACKMVDRIVLRGDQQVFVLPADDLHVFGYFERVGFQAEAHNYRPLEPTTPVAPNFSPSPSFLVGAGGSGAQGPLTVHQMTSEYIDYLDLSVAGAIVAAGPTGTPGGTITFPGGVVLDIEMVADAAVPIFKNSKLLDGIPMRAPSDTDNLIQLSMNADDVGATSVVANGFFDRG